MRSREEFDTKLRELIGNGNLYFQPSEQVQMKYPCIVYKRSNIDLQYADNKAYIGTNCYEVTVISKNPDYHIVEEIPFVFPMCRFNRFYTADNLNHNSFTIYY